jgi:pilus assembly protein Flp/PilA
MFSIISVALNFIRFRKPGFLRDERGVTTIEYGILAAGLAVLIAALVSGEGGLNKALNDIFEQVVEDVSTEKNETPS